MVPYMIISLVILVFFAIPHLLAPIKNKELKQNPWYYALGMIISGFLFIFLLLSTSSPGVSFVGGSIAAFIWLANAVMYALLIPIKIYLQKTEEK